MGYTTDLPYEGAFLRRRACPNVPDNTGVNCAEISEPIFLDSMTSWGSVVSDS